MHKFVWQRKIFLALLAPLMLSACFKSGDDLDPNNEGKARFNITTVNAKPESQSVQFQLTLNREVKEDIELNFTTAAGTATAGVDYVETAGTFTIPAGSTTLLITVPVMDDLLVEEDETLSLVISGEHKRITLNSTSAEATILDNDTYPEANISDISNLESGDAVFTVTLDKTYPEDITINYTTSDATATAGADYTVSTGTLTILAGNLSGTITVPVNDDTLDENDETLNITLSNPVNVLLGTSTAVATIQDDDGTPNLDVADVTVAEAADIVFTVSIPTASALPISFDWATSDNTAFDAFDYTAATGTAIIPAGSTSTTITISGLEDTLSENTEYMNLSISNVTNGMLGDAVGQASITDNDPLPQISIADVSVTEGNNASLTVTMNGVAGRDISFDWLTNPGTATHDAYIDFTQVTATTVTITAGNTTANLNVTINDDALDEFDENFTVDLNTPVNVTISDAQAVVTVQDNDAPPTVDFSLAAATINENEYGDQPNRIRLDFANSSRATNLVDFPVLVRLNATKIDYTKTNDDGSNIRFVDSDNTTMLSYEIEKWDEAGESLVWVKVPQIDASSDTDHIYMYYGDSSLEDAQDPENVWSNKYVSVYHMEEDDTQEVKDSSSTKRHGSNVGTTRVAGQISNSRSFYEGDIISFGLNSHLPRGSDPISICAWSSQASFNGSGEMIFSHGRPVSPSGIFLGSSDNKAWGGGWGGANTRSTTAMSTNTWHYLCTTYNGTTVKVFLDGSQDASANYNYNIDSGNTYMGMDPYGNGWKFSGYVDELRVSNIERSPDWLDAEYASMSGGLITYNAEEIIGERTLSISISGLSGKDITVPYTISGTSDATDHTLVDGSFTISAESGTTASTTYRILNDAIGEAQESLVISQGSLVNVDPGTITTQTITIDDDDATPEINFDIQYANTSEAPWYNSSWLNRTRIDIETSRLQGANQAFPVLVKLDSTRIDYTKTKDAGEDIRFISADGEEVLPFEIEKWDEAGSSYVWVRVPNIDAGRNDNFFYLYYNNASASDAQNKTAVWNSDYRIVAHMNDISDSSAFNITGTEANSSIISEGPLGNAYDFDGSTDEILYDDFGSMPRGSEGVSFCAWVLNESTSSKDMVTFAGSGNNHKLFPSVLVSQNNDQHLWYNGGVSMTSSNIYEKANWRHFCYSHSGTGTFAFWADGYRAEDHGTTNPGFSWGQLKLSPNSSKRFDGKMDEVRIYGSFLSYSTMILEYLSQSDKLLNFGSEEAYTANNQVHFKAIASRAAISDITVPYSISGTSTSSDHDIVDGSITILSGQTEVSKTITITDDTDTDPDENIIVTMGSPTGATKGTKDTITIEIIDNELEPVLNFTTAGQRVDESSGLVTVNLNLNEPAGLSGVSIPYTLTGTATGGLDHDLVNGTATINSGNTSTSISFNITDDSLDEYSESVIISLGSITGARLGGFNEHHVVIDDNDASPVLSIDSPSIAENAGNIVFTVSLDAPSGKNVHFDWAAAEATARATHPLKNFNLVSGTRADNTHKSILAGDTSVTISVPIIDNDYKETDKTFTMTISNQTNSSLGTDIGTGTILDDEVTPTANFNLASQTINEKEIWWDSNYAKRVKLTFNNSAQDSDLVNFPVLVKLNATRVDYASTANDGSDIRFVSSDGITILNHDIEKWDEAGDSFVWVRVPRIYANTNDNYIYMYYDNPSPDGGENKTGTWSNHELVYHMNSTSPVDVTGQIALTNNGTSILSGIHGNAASFSGSNQFVTSPDDMTSPLDTNLSISTWVKTSSGGIIVGTNSGATAALNKAWIAFSSGQIGIWDDNAFDPERSITVNDDQWHHVYYTLSGSTGNLYIDGQYQFSHTNTAKFGEIFSIGQEYDDNYTPSQFYSGLMDSFRIYNSAVSKDWVQAQYLSESDQFISYGSHSFGIRLDIASETDITVPYTISGTSTNPSDHDLVSGSVVIPAYQLSGNIPVNIVDDAISETDESLILTMGTPINANKGATDVHTTTIEDDDGKASISINDVSIGEGGTASITVSLDISDAGTITVDYATTSASATSGTDFTAASGTLTFNPGETSKTFDVATTADTLDEYNEFFRTLLSNNTGNSRIVDALGSVTITDDDPLVDVDFSVATNTVDEGDGTVTITARLSAVSGKTVRLPFSVSGTAVNPEDHSVNDSQITISAGNTTRTFNVNIIDDALDEVDETIIFTAGSPTAANLATNTVHTMTITDNDALPTITAQTKSVDESVGTVNVDVNLSAVSGKNVSFDWSVNSGTANVGSDFAFASASSVLIPAGSSSVSISIPVTDDNIFEGNESFTVALSNLSEATLGANGTITITDNDPEPSVSFDLSAIDVMESEAYRIPVQLDVPSKTDITFDLTLTGTATNPSDYSLIDGTTITIPAGETKVEIDPGIVSDLISEVDETLILDITGITGGTSGTNTQLTITIKEDTSLTVAPTYASNANWNDYVLNDEPGKAKFMQSDDACAGASPTSVDACVNGGEYRKVDLGGTYATCTNLSMNDSLNAFDWICDDSGPNAIFYSNGLKEGKGLSSLIDFADGSFKEMSIVLKSNNQSLLGSARSIWWSNTVTALPDNAATSPTSLANSGSIYFFQGSRNTMGYSIDADKVALVLAPGSILTYAVAGNNCSSTTGETSSPDQECVITAGSQNYLWIEGGSYEAGGIAHLGLNLQNIKYSRLNQIQMASAWTSNLLFSSLEGSTLTGIKALNSSTNQMSNGRYNKMRDMNVFNTLSIGLNLMAESNSYLTNIKVHNAGNNGIQVTNGSPTRIHFNNILVSNSGQHGISSDAAGNILYQNLTLVNNSGDGINLGSGSSATVINNIVAANNALSGIDSQSQTITNTQISQASLFNNLYGLSLDSSSNHFTNNLLISNNTTSDCNVIGGTDPGLIDGTCANQASSDANLVGSIDITNSFVGKVLDDSVNTSDTSGAAAYTATGIDVMFENVFRTWGLQGSAFPNSDHRGRCSSGTCHIWDWSLNAADTVLRNTSFDGLNPNTTFVDGGACPAAIHGDKVISDLSGTEVALDAIGDDDGICEAGEACTGTTTWLISATEILGDKLGNDDGLCESNEACYYNPNFGVYQGSGSDLLQCTFTNGAVTNVKMYALPKNGN